MIYFSFKYGIWSLGRVERLIFSPSWSRKTGLFFVFIGCWKLLVGSSGSQLAQGFQVPSKLTANVRGSCKCPVFTSKTYKRACSNSSRTKCKGLGEGGLVQNWLRLTRFTTQPSASLCLCRHRRLQLEDIYDYEWSQMRSQRSSGPCFPFRSQHRGLKLGAGPSSSGSLLSFWGLQPQAWPFNFIKGLHASYKGGQKRPGCRFPACPRESTSLCCPEAQVSGKRQSLQ